MTPAAAIRARAEELRDSGELGFATDLKSYPGTVLVGLSTQRQSLVLTVDAAEWTLANSLALARSFGYPDQKPNAYAQAMKAKQ